MSSKAIFSLYKINDNPPWDWWGLQSAIYVYDQFENRNGQSLSPILTLIRFKMRIEI